MATTHNDSRPSLSDQLWQKFYIGAYWLMRLVWIIRRPRTHGALVAAWHQGRILLVRSSYLSYWNLPGGYVGRGETAREAACRELEEEVGLRQDPRDLVPALDIVHRWQSKHDHVEIFSIQLQRAPRIEVDHREVVEARFVDSVESFGLKLFPPARSHIRQELDRMERHAADHRSKRSGAAEPDETPKKLVPTGA